ncbi:T9SS type A sorting domain-containing protein [Lewinella sp. JB7]|uniref:T9SS type A sorting domain-containing protein n=1 Tax=Lewinella sp. JB7 TaxID=2962887 RepID=UPI0035324CF6
MPQSGDLWLRVTATCSNGTTATDVHKITGGQGTGPEPDSLASDGTDTNLFASDALLSSDISVPSLRVFPNLSVGVFSVMYRAKTDGKATVQLHSLGGRRVFTRTITLKALATVYQSIDVDLPTGTYILTVTDGLHTYTRKVSIQ